jgi:hypothetical protein
VSADHDPAVTAITTAGESSRDALNFRYADGGTVATTLFDYLMIADVDLGLNTTIEYVGMTATPEDRPKNLEHRRWLLEPRI